MERRFKTYDTRDMSLLSQWGPDVYADRVATSVDGKLYGVVHAADGPQEAWVFDEAGTSLGTYRLAPTSNAVGDIEVSGDGKRFVSYSNLPTLEFITAP
jgi:hypothetical protein